MTSVLDLDEQTSTESDRTRALALGRSVAGVENYLAGWGYLVIEAGSSLDELGYLMDLVRRLRPRVIGEIGFNTGYSSHAFLLASPEVQVVSFDLGGHPYIGRAKDYLDRCFPGRHELVLGDSTETVPRYVKEQPELCVDLVFVDGGHQYEVARSDLHAFRASSHPGTVVVIDDLTPWAPWGRGPTQAWQEAIDDGVIAQEEIFSDGLRVERAEYPAQRVWAAGRYLEPGRPRRGDPRER